MTPDRVSAPPLRAVRPWGKLRTRPVRARRNSMEGAAAGNVAGAGQSAIEAGLRGMSATRGTGAVGGGVAPTDVKNPDYFHKVVDCQWACPAHTPVPEYIRLIAAGRYSDAYLVNWHSNVFPGILGRTCDRPCEPACRRGRVEAEPVAI